MKAQARYRVWCLSWEEDEDDGCDVVGYDILTHDYSKRERGVVFVASLHLYDLGDAAEAYADYVHSNRDGCECSWPLVFRVRGLDGETADFEVDREYVPEFTARPVKALAAKQEVGVGQ